MFSPITRRVMCALQQTLGRTARAQAAYRSAHGGVARPPRTPCINPPRATRALHHTWAVHALRRPRERSCFKLLPPVAASPKQLLAGGSSQEAAARRVAAAACCADTWRTFSGAAARLQREAAVAGGERGAAGVEGRCVPWAFFIAVFCYRCDLSSSPGITHEVHPCNGMQLSEVWQLSDRGFGGGRGWSVEAACALCTAPPTD